MQNRQLLLAAQLMARPDLINGVFSQQTAEQELLLLSSLVARATIGTLMAYGPAYANPGAMSAALRDLPAELDGDEVVTMFTLIPEAEEVTLEGLISLRDDLLGEARKQQLGNYLVSAGRYILDTGDPEESVPETVERKVREYRQGRTGVDASAAGVMSDLEGGDGITTRWKCGSLMLDGLMEGVDHKGDLSNGLLGQGEVTVLAAQYGVGKTRLVLNWVDELLKQDGSSVAILATEDTRGTYLVKLISIRYNLEKWRIDQHLAKPQLYLDRYGAEESTRVKEAVSWGHTIGERLRIYDGRKSRVNIFRFPKAKGLLEEDAAVYGTTHTVVDYVQAWPGETITVEGYAQELRELASRNNVGLILLSQVSNETMGQGAVPGTVPTKGSGAWGAIAHFGFYIERDPLIGQKEIKLSLTKGRESGASQVWAHFNVVTGKVTEYVGAPTWMGLPQPDDTGGAKSRGKKTR